MREREREREIQNLVVRLQSLFNRPLSPQDERDGQTHRQTDKDRQTHKQTKTQRHATAEKDIRTQSNTDTQETKRTLFFKPKEIRTSISPQSQICTTGKHAARVIPYFKAIRGGSTCISPRRSDLVLRQQTNGLGMINVLRGLPPHHSETDS